MWFGFYKSFTAICLESDLPHLWLQFLLTTHTKWSIICNFAWTKLFEAFNNSKCIPRNFKHSDLHIIGLRASFWSRTLHKLVIPFLQAHKKWCLIEMAFWRQNLFFSFFFFFLNNFTTLQRSNFCILRIILYFKCTYISHRKYICILTYLCA